MIASKSGASCFDAGTSLSFTFYNPDKIFILFPCHKLFIDLDLISFLRRQHFQYKLFVKPVPAQRSGNPFCFNAFYKLFTMVSPEFPALFDVGSCGIFQQFGGIFLSLSVLFSDGAPTEWFGHIRTHRPAGLRLHMKPVGFEGGLGGILSCGVIQHI